MAKDCRVINLTRGFKLKRNQALKAVDECACAWVVFGESIRDLSLAESISRRIEQSRLSEPLPPAELEWLFFKPSINGQLANRQSYKLIQEANRLCNG